MSESNLTSKVGTLGSYMTDKTLRYIPSPAKPVLDAFKQKTKQLSAIGEVLGDKLIQESIQKKVTGSIGGLASHLQQQPYQGAASSNSTASASASAASNGGHTTSNHGIHHKFNDIRHHSHINYERFKHYTADRIKYNTSHLGQRLRQSQAVLSSGNIQQLLSKGIHATRSKYIDFADPKRLRDVRKQYNRRLLWWILRRKTTWVLITGGMAYAGIKYYLWSTQLQIHRQNSMNLSGNTATATTAAMLAPLAKSFSG